MSVPTTTDNRLPNPVQSTTLRCDSCGDQLQVFDDLETAIDEWNEHHGTCGNPGPHLVTTWLQALSDSETIEQRDVHDLLNEGRPHWADPDYDNGFTTSASIEHLTWNSAFIEIASEKGKGSWHGDPADLVLIPAVFTFQLSQHRMGAAPSVVVRHKECVEDEDGWRRRQTSSLNLTLAEARRFAQVLTALADMVENPEAAW